MGRIRAIAISRLPRMTGAVALACTLLAAGPGAAGSAGTHAASRVAVPWPGGPGFRLQVPLGFEPNLGTGGAGASFLARAPGYSAAIGPTSLQIMAGDTVVRLSYLGTDPGARLTAEGQLPGTISSFRGRDPRRWLAGIHTYARLRIRDLYRGIDLLYYAGRHGLEYDLVVHPGADPRRIRIATPGGQPRLRGGELVWRIAGGTLALAAPTIYQREARTRLAGGYRLSRGGVLSFSLAGHDPRRTLVIDPYLKVIGTSGYNSIGGTGTAIAIDGAGNTYVTGTGSGQFPTTRGAAQTTLANQNVADSAIVVIKLDRAGKILFSTYLGTVPGDGTTGVSSAAIAVDGAGNVYVTGSTMGYNFPLVHPLISYPPPNGGSAPIYHAFVAKLDPTGSKLLYSTYLGGDMNSGGRGIAVDRAGTAYVAGSTAADENPDIKQFPVTAQNKACSPGTDGFVVMINPTGSKLLDAFCIGATGATHATAIALDQARNVYVTGYTNSYPPPERLRLVSEQQGVNNVFVVKYDPSVRRVLYAAFLGGSGDNRATAVAVDPAGHAYITGGTTAEDFPTTGGAFMRQQAAPNAAVGAVFVAALAQTGDRLRYSTYLSGTTDAAGTGIAVDTHGDAFVTGTIARNLNMAVSADQVTFPVTKGAMHTGFNANGDGFLTELNPGGTGLRSSTTLGGVVPTGLALGPSGHPSLTGSVTQQDPQIPEAKDTWFVAWSL